MKLKMNKKVYEVYVCSSFKSKFLGFMFKKNIDKILCFRKCNSIHTFFMLKAIDVVMTDKNYNVIKVYNSLKPWKVILPKKHVFYTFEFAPNLISVKKGDTLKIED